MSEDLVESVYKMAERIARDEEDGDTSIVSNLMLEIRDAAIGAGALQSTLQRLYGDEWQAKWDIALEYAEIAYDGTPTMRGLRELWS